MDRIVIDLAVLSKLGVNINEYLVLYDVANELSISSVFNYGVTELVSLEKKGLIKLTDTEIFLRGKGTKVFSIDEDLFETWLSIYPTTVKKSSGEKRALSPSSPDTILGERLKKKWNAIFKRDKEKQLNAIEVLKAEIKSKTKDGSLEYMVEAARWLNEGFFEKLDYLVENDNSDSDNYLNEDYL